MCLAAINQFLATCSNPRWQRWSNVKIAHWIMVASSQRAGTKVTNHFYLFHNLKSTKI